MPAGGTTDGPGEPRRSSTANWRRQRCPDRRRGTATAGPGPHLGEDLALARAARRVRTLAPRRPGPALAPRRPGPALAPRRRRSAHAPRRPGSALPPEGRGFCDVSPCPTPSAPVVALISPKGQVTPACLPV